MNRRTFLRGMTASGALLAAPSLGGLERAFAQQTGSRRKPNIIFILGDDWGWGDLGCYGHRALRTPHLDKMAAQGTLWTNFYCNGSVCSPSRAAFMTGRFPADMGIHHIMGPGNKPFGVPEFLDPQIPNVARLLKGAGYATAHFGKWHLGATGDAPPVTAYGFNEAIGFVSKDASALEKLGKKNRPNASTRIVDEAIRFLGAHREQPVYLNLWLLDTHTKLEPTAEQMEAYKGLPEGGARRIYYSAATDSDRQIGRLLDYLDQNNLSQNTLVVFSSDNGPEETSLTDVSVGSAGPFRGRKRSLYEGGIRVPFIARWPGAVPAGRIDNGSVLSGVDFLPTFCALAGVAVPQGANLRGQDMSAALRGQTVRRQNPLFWEWRFHIHGPNLNRSPQLAMRQDNWKLLMNPDRSRVELYDLTRDAGEVDNLAVQNPQVVAAMSARLMAWKASVPAGKGDADAGSNTYAWPGTVKTTALAAPAAD